MIGAQLDIRSEIKGLLDVIRVESENVVSVLSSEQNVMRLIKIEADDDSTATGKRVIQAASVAQVNLLGGQMLGTTGNRPILFKELSQLVRNVMAAQEVPLFPWMPSLL